MNKYLLFAALFVASTFAQDVVIAVLNSGSSFRLINFTASSTGVNSPFIGAEITGIVAGQVLRSIDYRPATGQLYGLSSSTASGSRNAQIYTINFDTGVASPVGSGFQFTTTSDVQEIDFNPSVDLIRLVAQDGVNYRVNPNTGAVVAQDVTLAFATGTGTPAVASIAYANNTAGAAVTTLFGQEITIQQLVSIAPPNAGTVNPIGSANALGGIQTPVSFDISGATATAYVIAGGVLSTQDLTTGTLTSVGSIANLGGGTILDASVLIAPVAQITSAQVTSASVTSAAFTSGVSADITSASVTSAAVTSGASGSITSASVTSAAVTSAAQVTTGVNTTAAVTTSRLTSSSLTGNATGNATTGPVITSTTGNNNSGAAQLFIASALVVVLAFI